MELTETYPVSTVCQALNLPRSSYYYRSQRGSEEDLRAALLCEAETWPTYGYRRITQELRRKGWVVNSKKVRRLMREMGLQVKKRTRRRRTTDSRHDLARFPNLIRGLEIARPDQVWAADITYVRLQREFVYLAVIMDLFTRGIRGWHLGRRLDHTLTLTALKKALGMRKAEIHHSDQGVQYATWRYVEALKEAQIQISIAKSPRMPMWSG
jgi:transposase InsO family protein